MFFDLKDLTDLTTVGYIDSSIVASLKEVMNKEIERKVLELHKLPIKEVFVNKRGDGIKQKYYQTTAKWLPSGHIRMKNYEDVVSALADHYCLNCFSGLAFQAIFERALEEKQTEQIVSVDTIGRLRTTYRSYVSVELSKLYVTKIDASYLNKYCVDLIKSKNLKRKAFLNFKGVLNLVFGFAYNKNLIPSNPVSRMTRTSDLLKGCSQSPAKEKIFTPKEIDLIRSKIIKRLTMCKYTRNNGYDIAGYMMLLAIESGLRAAELCALKWSDIKDTCIWVHSQQLHPSGDTFVYTPWTKNDKDHTGVGRAVPLFPGISRILDLIKAEHDKLGISSEYVFGKKDGSWYKTEAYESVLRRLCKSLGFNVTNNHAFRKYFNSYVLIPAGYTETDRAAILGHSPETNLKYYSIAPEMDDDTNLCFIEKMRRFESGNQIGNQILSDKIVSFETEKNLRTANS